MSFNSTIMLLIDPKEMIRDVQKNSYSEDVNSSSTYKIWKQQRCQTMKQWLNITFGAIHATEYSAARVFSLKLFTKPLKPTFLRSI